MYGHRVILLCVSLVLVSQVRVIASGTNELGQTGSKLDRLMESMHYRTHKYDPSSTSSLVAAAAAVSASIPPHATSPVSASITPIQSAVTATSAGRIKEMARAMTTPKNETKEKHTKTSKAHKAPHHARPHVRSSASKSRHAPWNTPAGAGEDPNCSSKACCYGCLVKDFACERLCKICCPEGQAAICDNTPSCKCGESSSKAVSDGSHSSSTSDQPHHRSRSHSHSHLAQSHPQQIKPAHTEHIGSTDPNNSHPATGVPHHSVGHVGAHHDPHMKLTEERYSGRSHESSPHDHQTKHAQKPHQPQLIGANLSITDIIIIVVVVVVVLACCGGFGYRRYSAV